VVVRFARGARELTSFAEAEVERAARCFRANREPRVAIEQSGDGTASAEANEELTKARVTAVQRALEQRGVPAAEVRALGSPDMPR
jgi:outer membrane protein OmpA-like peptidoglycan-associated protein